MKKTTLILLLLCVKIYSNCQEWQSSSIINGTGIEPKYSTLDLQGNIYILSQFLGTISDP